MVIEIAPVIMRCVKNLSQSLLMMVRLSSYKGWDTVTGIGITATGSCTWEERLDSILLHKDKWGFVTKEQDGVSEWEIAKRKHQE
jgi:hypothetical protein